MVCDKLEISLFDNSNGNSSMKNRMFILLMVLMVGLFLLGTRAHKALAFAQKQSQVHNFLMSGFVITQTPVADAYPINTVTETPEERKLPAVGSNAILVLGASILVLIVIWGVMFSSRRRSKH
jgi:hypothetical protein